MYFNSWVLKIIELGLPAQIIYNIIRVELSIENTWPYYVLNTCHDDTAVTVSVRVSRHSRLIWSLTQTCLLILMILK